MWMRRLLFRPVLSRFGGALEYLALLTGYRSLLLVVAGLYLLAWLFATQWRVLADTALARDGADGASGELAGEESAAVT